MRTPKHTIFYKSNNDVFYIKPFFDVHWGSNSCDEKAFKEDLKSTCENTYLLFGGDLFDSLVVTDPRYRKSNDKTVGDDILDELIDEMVEILKPYRHRILGIGRGNHEDVVTKKCGTDLIRRICRRLEVQDIGYSGLYRLMFRQKNGGGRKVIIRYHHGWGGGSRTQGADLTKFSKDISYWQADLFLYGHVHRKQTDTIPRLGLAGAQLTSKPKVLCICGTYLKTYTNSIQPTYSEVKGYPPVSVGGVTVSIRPRKQWVEMKARVD